MIIRSNGRLVLKLIPPMICWSFIKRHIIHTWHLGWRHSKQAALTCHFSCSSHADPRESLYSMRLVWKSLDKMRCLRKRSTIPFLGFLITFLLFLNLYIEDGYVLVCKFVSCVPFWCLKKTNFPKCSFKTKCALISTNSTQVVPFIIGCF